ncbi:hypothetical protein ABMA28_009430 [Loxostege sticticalis]|uniref:Reverse transcriptase domain-containing protein n=1 Tax=Loxostege sticticalis TaxID=481309 RepID=A0ABD0SD97_LOXSC
MQVNTHKSRLPCDPPSNRRRDASGARGEKWVTGHVGVGDQTPHGKNATGNSVRLRDIQKIGTWNIRGLLEPGKLDTLEGEVTRCGLSICGLSETHWRNNGHFLTESHAIYFSGNDDKSQNGVAILVPKQQRHCVLGYEPVNDRIISIKLKASPMNLNLIQVYAPTSTSSAETSEQFYADLQTVIAKIPNRELLLILGDFNSKIGANSQHYSDCVGKFGLGTRNERGERLMQFANENNLIIANSLFQHHPRRLYTWTSPGGKYRNQIDYILVKSRWRTSILNAHTLPGACCGSDHELLITKLRLKLRAARSPTKQKRLEVVDTERFATVFEQGWAEWTDISQSEATPDLLWNKAKHLIQSAVAESKPPIEMRKRQHWMSDSTLALVEERRHKKAQGVHANELNKLSATIQTSCRRDYNSHLQGICKEVEKHATKHESRDLYHKIRVITKSLPSKTWAIENDMNEVLTDLEDILERWKSYCQSLFQDPQSQNFPDTEPNSEDLEPNILLSEVRAAIKHLKNGKATGGDAIPIETIKALGEKGIHMFHTICNKVWQTGIWPSDWTHTIFVPLHKKGSTKKCNNYRLIALISHASKIILHILNERLKSYLSKEVAPEQAGFVKGKGTREQILIVRQIIEKSREFNKPTYICFVDFSKAFDSVKWPVLWKTLTDMGTPKHLIHLLRRLYEQGTASVRTDDVLSNNFHPSAGVRQGCIISPLLFNIYTELIMRITLEDWTDGVTIGGYKISNLRYADDTTLFATSAQHLEQLLYRMERVSNEFGLKINRNKTKVMIIDRVNSNSPETTQIAGCDVVQSYVYLGANLKQWRMHR